MSVFSSDNTQSSSSRKRPDSVQAIHTLLGKGTAWKGEIHSGPNSLRIEGSVEGTIHSEGEVTIAPTGYMKGTIHAKHLIVTGKVEGIFKIAECLEIHGTGWVEGEVEVGSLVVDEGGTLQGSCTRRGASKPKDGKEAVSTTKSATGKPEDRFHDRFHDRPPINGANGSSSAGMDHAFPKPAEATK
jgi:cytoskeletal protein CcmA (bactofilin family)